MNRNSIRNDILTNTRLSNNSVISSNGHANMRPTSNSSNYSQSHFSPISSAASMQTSAIKTNKNVNNILINNNINSNASVVANHPVCAIGEKKRVKVHFIQSTQQQQQQQQQHLQSQQTNGNAELIGYSSGLYLVDFCVLR